MRGDVTYAQFYRWLNGLWINPCWGWLNNNATVRDLTSQHAAQLSAVYPKVIREHQFENLAKVIGHPEWCGDPRFASRDQWDQYKETLDTKKGRKLVEKCLVAAMARDSASGNGIRIVTITEGNFDLEMKTFD